MLDCVAPFEITLPVSQGTKPTKNEKHTKNKQGNISKNMKPKSICHPLSLSVGKRR